MSIPFLNYVFIYLWPCFVFTAACGLALVVKSGTTGECTRVSSWRLLCPGAPAYLLWSTGFSALEHSLLCPGAQTALSWSTGWSALEHRLLCPGAPAPGPVASRVAARGLRGCAVQAELLFNCSVVSNSLRPHGPQHARLPCPSPTPGAG